ncbi:MAG: sulfite exporter TauE/SafE family protein [Ruminococcaceae bacterium]|nr:sulfite exporter TauE/SafE family protein [Oscillospiraceae bacterium]
MIIVNMLAASLIGILAGLGVGGGGLLVIYLTLVLGTEQLQAQGINLCFFIICSASSLCIHFKKRKINIRQILALAITGIVSSLLGAYISRNIDASLLRRLFGGLLVISGALAFFSKKKG